VIPIQSSVYMLVYVNVILKCIANMEACFKGICVIYDSGQKMVFSPKHVATINLVLSVKEDVLSVKFYQ
jgi:hypothetical protein